MCACVCKIYVYSVCVGEYGRFPAQKVYLYGDIDTLSVLETYIYSLCTDIKRHTIYTYTYTYIKCMLYAVDSVLPNTTPRRVNHTVLCYFSTKNTHSCLIKHTYPNKNTHTHTQRCLPTQLLISTHTHIHTH